MKKLVLSLTLLSLFATTASAAILIEPYVGTHFNSEYDGGSGADGDYTGMNYGARIGYQNLGLMFGLNYKTGDINVDFDNSDADATITNYGAFIGYNFPVMFRVWGEYIIGGGLDVDNGGEFEGVSGTQLGVGYTGLPFVSINLEIGNLTYDELENSNAEADVSTYFLSVSLPLTF